MRGDIDGEKVARLRAANQGWQKIADAVGVSMSALYAWRREGNDVEVALRGAGLLAAILELNAVDPNPYRGIRTTRAYFVARGFKVYRLHVAELLLELYPQEVHNRTHRVIYRRSYVSPGYGHCWHIDSWHKSHRYGIVVTGGVDGYSKLITAVRGTTLSKCSRRPRWSQQPSGEGSGNGNVRGVYGDKSGVNAHLHDRPEKLIAENSALVDLDDRPRVEEAAQVVWAEVPRVLAPEDHSLDSKIDA